MNVVGHLLSLSAIILALGIANILLFVASMLQRRRDAAWSLRLILWASSIFLSHVVFWFGSYAFLAAPTTSIPSIAFVLGYPVLLFLQSALVAPPTAASGRFDLAGHFVRVRLDLMVLILLSTALNSAYFAWISYLNPQMFLAGIWVADGVFAATAIAGLWSVGPRLGVAAALLHLAAKAALTLLAALPMLSPA